jgi:tripartite ATP-independent transporter DctP family solute receptor
MDKSVKLTATRRSFTAAAAALLASTMLVAPAHAQQTIRLAHHLPTNSEQHVAAERFAEIVAERSNGALVVQILPGGQMGGQRELIEAVQLGTLEMAYGESGLYANFVPAFGILTLPYLYQDPTHWANVVTGDIGNGLVEELAQAADLRVLNWIQAGYRDTYTTTGPMLTPADFQGLRIRVPESPVFVETFAALGAQPTPIPGPEIYTALQAGVVAGMEGTPEFAFGQRVHEVAGYLSMTRHIFFDGSFVTSDSFLNGLSDENRTIVTEAAQEVAAMQRDEWAAGEEGWLTQLRDAGISIHEVDQEPFREALAPLRNTFAERAGAMDTLQAIYDAQ